MTTIKEFDKLNLKEVRDEIDKALIPVGQRFGITLNIENINYTPAQFSTKLKGLIATQQATGGGKDAANQTAFEMNCERFGLLPTDFGLTFLTNGDRYTVVGINAKAPKYPIICEKEDGSRYRLTARTVKEGLEQNPDRPDESQSANFVFKNGKTSY